MQFPPFKGLIAFDAVARLGSISKAAEELHITVSAVSHQIANLETFVGHPLFDRSPRGLTLTIHGERFGSDVSGALTSIAAATRNVRGGEVAEVLRIHAVPTFASLWLMPRLPSFRARHPALRVQLSATYRDIDFARAECDVDIRYGLPGGRDLHVETLFSELIFPMISPKLKATLHLEAPADLVDQDLILSELTLVQWPHWFAAHGVAECPASYGLAFDRTSMVLDAAIQGLGIALDSDRIAEAALLRGDLVPVFADLKGMTVSAHHLVYPRAHATRDRVVKFATWLREEAAAS